MILPQQTNCRSCCRSLQQLNLFLPLSQKNLLTYLGSWIQQLLLQSTTTSRELSFVASVLLCILVHAAAPTLLFKLSTVNHLISCCTYFLKKAEVEKSKWTTCSGPTKLPKQHNSVDAQTWQALHSSVWIKSNQLFPLLLPPPPQYHIHNEECVCVGVVLILFLSLRFYQTTTGIQHHKAHTLCNICKKYCQQQESFLKCSTLKINILEHWGIYSSPWLLY